MLQDTNIIKAGVYGKELANKFFSEEGRKSEEYIMTLNPKDPIRRNWLAAKKELMYYTAQLKATVEKDTGMTMNEIYTQQAKFDSAVDDTLKSMNSIPGPNKPMNSYTQLYNMFTSHVTKMSPYFSKVPDLAQATGDRVIGTFVDQLVSTAGQPSQDTTKILDYYNNLTATGAVSSVAKEGLDNRLRSANYIKIPAEIAKEYFGFPGDKWVTKTEFMSSITPDVQRQVLQRLNEELEYKEMKSRWGDMHDASQGPPLPPGVLNQFILPSSNLVSGGTRR